jgi:cephalosporin-C deacetylase
VKLLVVLLSFSLIVIALRVRAAESSLKLTVEPASGVLPAGTPGAVLVSSTGASGPIKVELKSNGRELISTADVSLQDGAARVPVESPQAGAVLAAVTLAGPDGGKTVKKAGLIFSPGKIAPAVPRPADFDAFWEGKLAGLAKVPMDPQVETPEQKVAGVHFAKFSLAVGRDQRVRGQMAWPDKPGKYPALVIFQWAGVYPLDRGTVLGNAQKGWLAVNVLPHDLPIDEPKSFYEEQAKGALKEYGLIGRDDRETSYFLRMYLGVRRVLDFVKTLPEWNGKTLVVHGTSMGAAQALVAAALDPDVTAVVANVPALCDQNGPEAGRGAPFPYWVAKEPGGLDPRKISEAARYFDVVHFGPRIQVPVLVSAGLADESCPPAGIAAMSNLLAGTKEVLFMPGANHQGDGGTHEPYLQRSKAWLETARFGRPLPPEL